jgi:hypothetical protein
MRTQSAGKSSRVEKKDTGAPSRQERVTTSESQGSRQTSEARQDKARNVAARQSASNASKFESGAREDLRTLNSSQQASSFTASQAAPAAAPTRAAASTLPPETQRALEAAQQATEAARTASQASAQATRDVEAARNNVILAQSALTMAQAEYDRIGGDLALALPGNGVAYAAKIRLEQAKAELAQANNDLAFKVEVAAITAHNTEIAANRAENAAFKLRAQAKQHPELAPQLEQAIKDANFAGSVAHSSAARCAAAGKPQAVEQVNYDYTYDHSNNGGQHDIVYDGAVIGRHGQVYPPGSDAGQVQGVLPNNGRQPTGERIYYVNGIMNDAGVQYGSAQQTANATGAEVIAIHNSTEGFIKDLAQCGLDKLPSFGSTNAATQRLALQIIKDLENNRPVHLMAHSQGGLVTSGALSLVKEYLETVKPADPAKADKLLSGIKVETFGSAAASWPKGPQYVHYINTYDTVPMHTGLGQYRDNPAALQENAGGERAHVHFITEDPRAVIWPNNTWTQTTEGIPAHDYNDGYLHHRMEWREAIKDNSDLTGQSPVAVRQDDGRLVGYREYEP